MMMCRLGFSAPAGGRRDYSTARRGGVVPVPDAAGESGDAAQSSNGPPSGLVFVPRLNLAPALCASAAQM